MGTAGRIVLSLTLLIGNWSLFFPHQQQQNRHSVVVSAASWITTSANQRISRHVVAQPATTTCNVKPIVLHPAGCSSRLLSPFLSHRPCMRNIASTCKLHMTREDDDEEEEDEDDDDDDEEDLSSNLDTSEFLNSHLNRPDATVPTFGLNRGRSSPSQRKAMGTSTNSKTKVHVCTNCSSEFVKWMGRCPTCRQWNTLQEYSVARTTASALRPNFNSLLSSSSFAAPAAGPRPLSWLDGTPGSGDVAWVRVTDLYPESDDEKDKNGKSPQQGRRRHGQQRIRIPGDDELNNVLGGGIMRGSLTLLGGDPGVGKSTLALQVAGSVASLSKKTQEYRRQIQAEQDDATTTVSTPNNEEEGPVWYVSGEENADQIASRAFRLGIFQPELWLLSETHLDTLAELVVQTYHPLANRPNNNYNKNNNDDDDDDEDDRRVPLQQQTPSLLVIDSIQTMVCDAGGSSAPGGITQVRECVALLLRLAKSTGVPVILIGHVTKDGTVAGPRTIEHMVDCVLYLEGTSEAMSGRDTHNVRMIRATKNRFGSADELGVYEMTTGRLLPVSDPSSLFLSHRAQMEDEDDEDDKNDTEGCAIALMLEGRRAMTVEVQALVTPVGAAGVGGRRTVNGGISTNRLLLLLGVLQKRCGMFWAKQDVYLNVVGQTLRWEKSSSGSSSNNAADLAVAMACVSSLLSIPVRPDAAFCGEVGLLGELRKMSSSALTKRLQEARRMGFTRVVTPKMAKSPHEPNVPRFPGMEWIQCSTLLAALNAGLVSPVASAKRRRSSSSSDATSAGGDLSKPQYPAKRSWNKGGWKPKAAPSSLKDAMYNSNVDEKDIILDDEDDDDEEFDLGFQ